MTVYVLISSQSVRPVAVVSGPDKVLRSDLPSDAVLIDQNNVENPYGGQIIRLWRSDQEKAYYWLYAYKVNL